MQEQQISPGAATRARIMTTAEAWRATLHPSDAESLRNPAELLAAFQDHQIFASMLAREFPESMPGPYELSTEDMVVLQGLRRALPSAADRLWEQAYPIETA